MAGDLNDGLIYWKDGICGNVYITIDAEEPVIITFCHKIRIGVTLGRAKSDYVGKGTKRGKHVHVPVKSVDDDPVVDARGKEPSESDISQSLKSEHIAPEEVGDVEMTEVDDELVEGQTHIQHQEVALTNRQKTARQSSRSRRKTSGKEAALPSNDKEPNQGTCERENVSPRTLRRRNKKCRNPRKTANDKLKSTKIKTKTTGNIKKLPESSSSKGDKQPVPAVEKAKNNSISKIPEVTPKAKRSAKWKLACETTCPYCLKVFENQQAFYDHKKVPRLLTFACDVCHKAFPFKAHLQVHTRAYHSENPAIPNLKESESCKCDICGIEVRNMFALKKHLMFHTQEYFYSCCVCGKQFVEAGTMNNHMTTHKSGGMVKCTCCDQLFATRGALAKHKLALLEVKCHLCGEQFPNRTSRTQHYKNFHQNDILKCSKCSSMFSSKDELAVHMTKHKLYKKKQCTTCGKFFSRLEKHIITHKAQSDIEDSEFFVCDKCPSKFTNRSSFQRHLTTHSQDKPYQCPNCPRKFADCGVLRKHLRRHSSLMPYECEVCGKKCKEPDNLKVHMRIHSDTKHFTCPICPQAFNYKTSLQGHMRSRHSQNFNSTNLITQTSEARQEYDLKVKTDPSQSFEGVSGRLDQDQFCESRPAAVDSEPGQAFEGRTSTDMKQYLDNGVDVSLKSHFDENAMIQGSVNMLTRHPYEGHAMHINTLNMDPPSKQVYPGSSVTVPAMNLSSSYNQEGQVVVSSQAHEESSNVTSLDMTTINVSSMNVSLY